MHLSSRAVAILAAVLTAAAIGVGFWRLEAPSTPSGLSPASSTSLEQVRDMLRQRATRLSDGDLDGYLQPLSAAARAVEQPIAKGALSMSLAEIDLVFTPPINISENAPSFADVPVEFLYRYKDLPGNNIFRLTLVCTIERRNGSWMVTKSALETKHDDLAPLWATGATEVMRSPHFLALYRTGTTRVRDAVDLAEAAWGRLTAKLDVDIDPVQLVELCADRSQFEAVSNNEEPEGMLGYSYGEYDQTGTKVMRHVVIDLSTLYGPGSISEHGDSGQEFAPINVFQHELGHLALERLDAPNTPSWVAEAASTYLSGERRTLEWTEGQKSGHWDKVSFLDIDSLPSLPGEDYAYVNAAGLYLVQTFGSHRFFQFYEGYQKQSGAGTTDTLLLRHFGIDLSQLDTQTRAYIKAAVGAG